MVVPLLVLYFVGMGLCALIRRKPRLTAPGARA
jgi:Sec-independent protein secretion pathway component TatC